MGKASASENYYDILNVRRDCSDKEIKAAYVELSKKFHPDVQSVKSDSRQTAHFLKIAEAYQTLSKPKLRHEYDRNIQASQSMRAYETTSATNNTFHRPWEIKPDFDPNPGPYYGIKGLNKTTNSKVAIVLTLCGIFGGILGFIAVKQSFSSRNRKLDEVSARASEHHRKIRAAVENYSNDEQLQCVIDRMSRVNRSE